MERNALIGTIVLEVVKVKVYTFKCQSLKNDHKIRKYIYIYILQSKKKYLGFFELNPGRSSAERFGNDDDKCDLVWHWSQCAMVWRVMFMTCHGVLSFIAYPL